MLSEMILLTEMEVSEEHRFGDQGLRVNPFLNGTAQWIQKQVSDREPHGWQKESTTLKNLPEQGS
ncbi:hypothetical protein B879_01001 [Cecembia lonarensis LW9]|uniref:Uncharacterized protein n=1 Tax=Cecembia lonarensis (strain CCUG 58316 / KCTC 22772 / LW9) TaxID=1225176 RepID=K1LE48_CECL9|nr:hypothetical protein B879_01001 [Cecembia lonarensis LW9]